MSRQSPRPWIPFLLVLASLTSCQAAAPEDPKTLPAPIKVTDLDSALADLDKAISENAEQNQIGLIAGLTDAWDKTDEPQKKRFRGQLDQCLKHENLAIKRAVFEALGSLTGGRKNREAKISTVTLVQFLSRIRLEKKHDLVIMGLEALGRLQHVSGLAMLFDHLKHEDANVVVAAVAALANYENDKVDHRKLIFEKILAAIAGDPTAGVDPRVENTIDATLARITNRAFKGRDAWSRWWQSEGKKLAEW